MLYTFFFFLKSSKTNTKLIAVDSIDGKELKEVEERKKDH